MMNSSNSNSSNNISSPSTKNVRKPLNPLLLTSSSEKENVKDSQETFCSKFDAAEKNPSSDLFSEAGASSNLNDLIQILSNKVSNVCVSETSDSQCDKSEIVSISCCHSQVRGSDLFSQDIKIGNNEVVCLSSGPDTDYDGTTSSEEEVIEVSDEETDEYEKVEARINFMTSTLESRESSSSTLGRKSRMERFLKDVSQNLKALILEDDFKVKSKFSGSQIQEGYNQNGEIFPKPIFLCLYVRFCYKYSKNQVSTMQRMSLVSLFEHKSDLTFFNCPENLT